MPRGTYGPRITIDLTDHPEVFAAIKEAAEAMEWSPSVLLRRNLVAAHRTGADFKNALINLGNAPVSKKPWLSEETGL